MYSQELLPETRDSAWARESCADLHGAGQSPNNNSWTDSAHSLVENGTSCCSSLKSGEAAACKGFQRRRRAQTDTRERRAERAESLVFMGEVSAGRHALEGAPLAPGTQRTLDQLRDPMRRPTVPYVPLFASAHSSAPGREALNTRQRTLPEESQASSTWCGCWTIRGHHRTLEAGSQ